MSSIPQTIRVTGESLWPRLVPGQTYRVVLKLPVEVGQIVIFPHPHSPGQYLVKEVQAVSAGEVMASGTVPWSSAWKISITAILGQIVNSIH